MTSPAAPSIEAITPVATPGVDEDRYDVQLTAADNAAPDADVIRMHDSSQETDDHDNQGPQQHEPESGVEKGFKEERSKSDAEAAIPEDPQQDDHSTLQHPHNIPPLSMSEVSQMDALSALMAYAHPLPDQQLALGGSNIPATPKNALTMNGTMNSQQPYLESSPYMREPDETRISAYAMLEFPDGQFYMNTYSVILGRDLAAARTAMRRDAEEARRKEDAAAVGEPKTPVRANREESKYTKSVISESGGILREGDDSDSDERARRRKSRKASKKSKSTGSSSQRISRRNSLVQPNGRVEYQAQPQVRRYAPDSAGAVPVDPASLRPSPHDCPLVGIHPPASTAASGYKAISRQHVKIAYNSKKYLFEAEIIGRNGAFVDDRFYYHSEVVPLKSGSILQIGGVVVRFVLPDVAIGETGAERPIDYEDGTVPEIYSEGGKEMSFDFEDTPRDGVLVGDSSEEASNEGENDQLQNEDEAEDDEGGEEDEDEGGEEEDDEEEIDQSEQSAGEEEEEEEDEEDEAEALEPVPVPQKRRGPGRPPKNGIMSKREQALAKKAAQQKAKKTVPQPPPPPPPTQQGKNKVGRPRKHPRPETPPIKTEKRKYTKRKPKDPDAAVKREGSQEDDKPAKEKKEKKTTKPPRSPSPTFNEADLTPEQLAKPQANYVTLIHEALSNSQTGQMSLPQIYRAIQRKYPFFVLKCNTNGWQSSVRHNLSQHHAFRKVERDGKGWMWAIVDGVSIEKEKKRRPTPPLPMGHMHHQQIYRAGPIPQHMMPRPPGMTAPPPSYSLNGSISPNIQQGQPSQYATPPLNGYAMHGMPPPMNGHHPSGIPGTLPPNPTLGPGGATYSSPYAPKPTASAPTQQNADMIPHHHLATLGPPPPIGHHAVPPNVQQGLQVNDNIAKAIDTFKNALIVSLKGKSDNAEAVVTSAINRVLGITTQSAVPGDPNEEKIMAATRAMLIKLPGANFLIAPSVLQNQRPQQQQVPAPKLPQSSLPGNENSVARPSNGAGSELGKPPTLSIARPTFGHGPGRSNGASVSVPRPPMITPGMTRTNSGSPATALPRPSTLSSAPLESTLSASNMNSDTAQKTSGVNDNAKRPLEDAEDMNERDFKRLTTGPTPLKA